MNKWIFISLAIVSIPIVIAYMWIRHPVLCWRELKHSWLLVFRGKDDGQC